MAPGGALSRDGVTGGSGAGGGAEGSGGGAATQPEEGKRCDQQGLNLIVVSAVSGHDDDGLEGRINPDILPAAAERNPAEEFTSASNTAAPSASTASAP